MRQPGMGCPDTAANAAEFGYPGSGNGGKAAFPKVRLATIAECASHAPVPAAIGPCVSEGSGEQSLARELYPRLEEDWLLIADRNFYNWAGWCAAAGTGAALPWRVKSDLTLEPLEFLSDGSYLSVLVSPEVKGAARRKVVDAAQAGEGPALEVPGHGQAGKLGLPAHPLLDQRPDLHRRDRRRVDDPAAIPP
jgi:hypothetical protein